MHSDLPLWVEHTRKSRDRHQSMLCFCCSSAWSHYECDMRAYQFQQIMHHVVSKSNGSDKSWIVSTLRMCPQNKSERTHWFCVVHVLQQISTHNKPTKVMTHCITCSDLFSSQVHVTCIIRFLISRAWNKNTRIPQRVMCFWLTTHPTRVMSCTCKNDQLGETWNAWHVTCVHSNSNKSRVSVYCLLCVLIYYKSAHDTWVHVSMSFSHVARSS